MINYLHRKRGRVLDPQDQESAIAIIRREDSPSADQEDSWVFDTDLPESFNINKYSSDGKWDYFIAYYLSPKLVRLGFPIAKWEQEYFLEYDNQMILDILLKLDIENKDYGKLYCLVYRGDAIAVEKITAFLLLIKERFGGFEVVYGYQEEEPEQDIKQMSLLDIESVKNYSWKIDLNEDNKK